MIQRTIPWLQQPYPLDKNWPHALRVAVYSGLFITLFLFLFRPFGMQIGKDGALAYLLICTGFGLVTALIILLTNGLSRVFPGIFAESRWVLWKKILFNIFFVGLIGLGNMLYANQIWQWPLTWQTVLGWQGVTFAVGSIPSIFGAFYGLNKLNRRYSLEAARLSAQLTLPHDSPAVVPIPREIILTGDNQQERLSLQPEQLVYLSAADNYVQVFYWEKGVLKNKLLRATLRKMEAALSGQSAFFRCHRTFIVNLEKIVRVSGNAQGYRLHFENIPETVPVSRNLNEVIREKFAPIAG